MTGLTQGFSVLFHNAHLFGRTALYTHRGTSQETGFYYLDQERMPQLIEAYRDSKAGVVGLAEVWDDGMAHEIRSALASEFPYQAASPSAPGIARAIHEFQERWPRLADLLFGPCGGVINYFTKSHYTPPKPSVLSEVGSFLSEDLFVRGLSRWLRSGQVWGAGLLLLSRYPIVSSQFHPHETRADWEMLAGKGVLEATVRTEEGDVALSLGHFQEGTSKRAVQARETQIRRARERTRPLDHPLIHFGDFNIPEESPEYREMARILGLRDARTGPTYVEPNPYQDKLQAPRTQAAKGQRIDYIFHSEDLVVESARVLREEFRSRDGAYDLSDHLPVLAKFFLKSQREAQARRYARESEPAYAFQPAAAAG